MRAMLLLGLVTFFALIGGVAEAQRYMVRPGGYGYGPFHWGSGRYWGSWGGFAPGPRYYNPGVYSWQGISRWRYRGY